MKLEGVLVMLWTSRIGAFILLLLSAGGAQADTQQEVTERFSEFVAAQNAHDVEAVAALLEESSEFLWITRGAPIWGRDAALDRFATLYEGTWSLDPAMDALKIVELGPDAAQLYVPVTFMIAPAGQEARPTDFLLNQIWRRTSDGWRVSSILPIPVPPS